MARIIACRVRTATLCDTSLHFLYPRVLRHQLDHKLYDLLILGYLAENLLELIAVDQQKVEYIAYSTHQLQTVIQGLKSTPDHLNGPLAICLVFNAASSLDQKGASSWTYEQECF